MLNSSSVHQSLSQSNYRPIINRPRFHSSRHLSQTGTLFTQRSSGHPDTQIHEQSINQSNEPSAEQPITQPPINQTVRLSVHNKAFSNDELVINPRVFPTVRVGSIIAITAILNNRTTNQSNSQSSNSSIHQSSSLSSNGSLLSATINKSTIYLRINRLETVKGNVEVSIDQSIASACGFNSRDLVEVQSIDPSNYQSIYLEAVEFSFERSYIGRSDHFRVRSALQGQTLSINQSVNLFGMKFKVDELTRLVHDQPSDKLSDDSGEPSTSNEEATISVKSGLICPSTKFTFRSKSARLFLLVQLSEEMWEYADGQSNNQSVEIYFEKVVRFVRTLLCQWSQTQSSHTVSIILFSRTFMQPLTRSKQSTNQAVNQSTNQSTDASNNHSPIQSRKDYSESEEEIDEWSSDDDLSDDDESSDESTHQSTNRETYFNVDALGRVYADHYALVVDNESPPTMSQSINQTIGQTINSSIKQSNNQPNNQSNNQSTNSDDAQAWADSICVKLKQRFFDYPTQLKWDQSIKIPIDCIHYDRSAVNLSTNQSIHQTINQSVRDGIFYARRVPSSSVDGNLLEAINLSSSIYDQHFIDRDLIRTGQNLVILTAGVGLYFASYHLSHLTKQRMVDAGIGCDLVSVARPPLHAVPLFVYAPAFLSDPHKYVHDNQSTFNQSFNQSNNQLRRSKSLHRMDSQPQSEDYYVPHWISLYFLDRPDPNEQQTIPHSLNQSVSQSNQSSNTKSADQSKNQAAIQTINQSDSFSLLSTVKLYDFRLLHGESLSDWLFKPRGTINQSDVPCKPNHNLQSKYTQPRPSPRIVYQSTGQSVSQTINQSNKFNHSTNRLTNGLTSINQSINQSINSSKKPYVMPAAHLDYDQSVFAPPLHRAGDSNISLKSMASSASLPSPSLNQSINQSSINQQSVNKALATSGSFNHLPVLDSFSPSFAWRLTFARRWAHLFTNDALIDGYAINWKSLNKPALLPLTVDYSPSATELKQNYREYVYTLTLDQSINQPNQNNQSNNQSLNQSMNQSSDSELEMLQELVCQRLAHDFQLISKPAHLTSNQSTQLINQPLNLSTNQSSIETIPESDNTSLIDQSINESTSQSSNEPINQFNNRLSPLTISSHSHQSISQSTNQLISQPINHSINQSVNQSIIQVPSPTNKRTSSSGSSLMRLFQRKRRTEPELIDQPHSPSSRPSQAFNQSFNQSFNQPFNQSVNQSNNQLFHSNNQLGSALKHSHSNQSLNQSVNNQIINPSINQLINQSINQPPIIEYWLALRNTVHCLWLERYSGVVNVKRYLHDRAFNQSTNQPINQSINRAVSSASNLKEVAYHYYLHSPLIDRFQLANRLISQSNVDQTDWNFADQLLTSKDADYDANDRLRYRRIRIALIPASKPNNNQSINQFNNNQSHNIPANNNQSINNQSNSQSNNQSINQSDEQSDRDRIDAFVSLMKGALNVDILPITVADLDQSISQSMKQSFIVPRHCVSMPSGKSDWLIDQELEAEFGFAYRGVIENTARITQSINQSINQSFFLRYETFFHPRFSYHFEVHWLVAVGVAIHDWIRSLSRKAEKCGFTLVKIPSAQPTLTADPFHAPVRLSFRDVNSVTTQWARQELHERLIDCCRFVLDCQVYERNFYVHSTGAALIRSMSDGVLYVANPTDSKALTVFQNVHKHWQEVTQCREAMLAMCDDIEMIVKQAGQL